MYRLLLHDILITSKPEGTRKYLSYVYAQEKWYTILEEKQTPLSQSHEMGIRCTSSPADKISGRF